MMSLVRCSSAETCGGFNDAIVSVQRSTFHIFERHSALFLIGGFRARGREILLSHPPRKGEGLFKRGRILESVDDGVPRPPPCPPRKGKGDPTLRASP